jgi:hypothetical protein
MTQHQLIVLVELLGIETALLPAISDILVSGAAVNGVALQHGCDPTALQQAVERVTEGELRIRGAFVCHSPSCWEVVVGHHDHHRAPGKLQLKPGGTVRLICARVHVMLPVQVLEPPPTLRGYYQGVVLNVPHTSMKYRRGDGVMFSEDQAVMAAATRAPRRPIPI